MKSPIPLISVVTVVYNGADVLEKTIQSVIDQSFNDIEYIIIDGKSTDGTTDIIKKYEKQIDYWVSEPDLGIYDAMNKGIMKCTGKFTLFLNAGDYLFSNELFNNLHTIYSKELDENDLIYGRAKILKSNGSVLDLIMKHTHEELWKGPNFRHGALLTRTNLLKEIQFEVSDKLKISADFDFIYKCYNSKRKFLQTSLIFIVFKEEGISDNAFRQLSDNIYILKKYKDWTLKTKLHFTKKYILALLVLTPVKKINIVLSVLFREYIANQLINKIPSYFIRHFYYKRIVGIRIGKAASIHLNTTIQGKNIQIGQNTVINRRCNLDGRGQLIIGNNTSISPDVYFITADHDYNSINFSLRMHDIDVGNYVFIGSRAIITGTVKIGEGAVICAGAIVTKDVEPWAVMAGIPAKKIKERRKDVDYNPSWMGWFD